MRSGHQIAKQMRLFPPTVCAIECPSCNRITIHYWGKDKPEDYLALVCNECGDDSLSLSKTRH